MYTLHVGIVPTGRAPAEYALYDDSRIRAGTGRGTRDTITTDADLSYPVIIEGDTFELWGEKSNGRSLHLTISLPAVPEPTEVALIYREFAKNLWGGRLVDWMVLTNEENWKQAVQYYLFHGAQGGAVVAVEGGRDGTGKGT